MGAADEKHRRTASRTFGVANPVWLIVVLVVVTILLVHRLLPGPSPPPLPSYASADLKPKNYLNAPASAQNPFPFCPTNGPSDTLAAKYGAGTLSQTRSQLGSGYRIQRVLKRALSGQQVTISIIGGSISACHGAGDDPVSPKCYPSKFFDWWNTIFPHPATEITNGAMRRTNSDYFGFCSGHHIPDVTDLVIVELDSDDTPDEEKTQNFELLIRSLLTRPDQPAVLILGHFSPQVYQAYRYTGPDHWHDVVAGFYDVPHLSTKPLLFNNFIQDPKSINKYYADAILANPDGHTLLADVLIAYFQHMTCSVWNIATGEEPDPNHTSDKSQDQGGNGGLFGGIGLRKGVPEPGFEKLDEDGERIKPDASRKSTDPRLKVPPALMSTRPADISKFEEVEPYCVSANDLINPLPPSIFYGSGWMAYHPVSHAKQDVEGGATAAHYFYSTLPLSRIRVPIVVGHGDVGIYYMREGRDKLMDGGSEIECWVDDNYNGRKVLSNFFEEGNGVHLTLTHIDHFVSRGSHFVECQLMGEEGKGVPMFKIVGIFAN
ncbi:hypothetical protein P691DRAFT_661721 [Macrolepiota fuliginosa MF-IS2]|uniref:Capsular associated protein n=1 Tax=Macrolepiota fuliginosa MF-IS2 TaxID=1400762 RepID=A0A9P6C575_9AGAR|nr:hypothetical protein P691DRAFT_661721 [Macrolepiota fuliginosa MF-IS2]